MLTLSHEDLQIKVLPEFGGGIVEANFREMQFMCRPPTKAEEPKFLGNEDNWVRAWYGGWQPLLPNAGTEYLAGKFPQGFHGNASQTPWKIERATNSLVDLSWKEELLNCTRQIKVAKSEIFVAGTVKNLDHVAREIIITEHLIFGDEFLSTDVEIVVDQDAYFSELGLDARGENSKVVSWGDQSISNWKFVTSKTPARLGVFSKVGTSGVQLISKDIDFQLTWDQIAFPYAWIWEEIKASKGEPWNGEYLALGIEPSTCPHGAGLGNKKSSHVVKTLEPNEVFTWWVKLKINQEKDGQR